MNDFDRQMELMMKAHMTPDPTSDIRLLLTSIESALARGVVHRDQSGSILTTPEDVLDALLLGDLFVDVVASP
jgi:hypothetical protein